MLKSLKKNQMKTVNMKKITVEEKNRINKKKNTNDAAEEIICLSDEQIEHSQKVTEKKLKEKL